MPASPKIGGFRSKSTGVADSNILRVLIWPMIVVASLFLYFGYFRPYGQPDLKITELIHAIAVLTGDSGVNGTISFQQSLNGVRITGEVLGLNPSVFRGFHIHEYGDLSGGCASTGSHFNPTKQTHGAPSDRVRHVGDLGNIKSDENGVAFLDLNDNVIALAGPFSIIGRAVVVHTGTDDLGRGDTDDSKKTGNAGGRAACGVIGIAPTLE